jgi:GWxTD domain-containing protein
MKKIQLVLLLVITGLLGASAKQIKVALFYNQYLDPAGKPYVETYFSLDPKSVILKPNDSGQYQGGVEILLLFKQDSVIKGYDKLQLMGTAMMDTSQRYPFSVQQSRIKLAPGAYTMQVEIIDMYAPNDSLSFTHDFDVVLNREETEISNIMLLDSYRASNSESVINKWGYELVPIVPVGTYFLPEDFSSLPFYCEVINTDQHLGENEPFLIKYYLVDNLRNKVMNRYAGFQRASGAVVNPVLSTFNIANLPSGYYDLKVDVISKDNELIQKQKVSFYRSNPEADQKEYNLADVQLDNSFVTALNDVDTMTYYLDCLFPISTEAERRIAKNTMDTRDTERMQRFFLAFWNKRNPASPEEEWKAYFYHVKIANKQFGSTSYPGYRTDMGRVYLQYGLPSTIERSEHDPSNYPWQMWQYDVLESASTPRQNNQIFVFVDQTLAGRNFTLIHSTAISEVKDRKWQFALNRNTNRGYDVDDTSMQYDRDNFGYRVNNNFIIGDQRFWDER